MAAGSPESSVFWAHIEKRRDFLVFSCLLLAGFSIYVSPRWHYFHSDEVVWFHALHAQNDAPLLWREFWTGSPWDYRPLKSLYLVTLHKILGDWSEAFHATNVLLHAGSAILVYLLALRLRLETVPAWLAAFLVVVHPAPYQAVRWVIDCASLLQAFFCLLALLPLLIYIDGRRPLYLWLALLAAPFRGFLAQRFHKLFEREAALYKEIADKLGIGYETVHTYIRRIYEKLQVRTRTEAVAKFLRR